MAEQTFNAECGDLLRKAVLIMASDYNDYKVEATLKDGNEIAIVVNSSSIDSAISEVKKYIIEESNFTWDGVTKVSAEIYHD